MADVTSIHGEPIRSGKGVNQSAIDVLETINEMVRSGEIVGFRAAIQYADGSTGISSGGFCRMHPIIGALNNLIYKENSALQD